MAPFIMRSGAGGGLLRPPHVCQSRGEQPRGGALCAGHVAPPLLLNASYAAEAVGHRLWVQFYTGGPTWVLHQQHICHQCFSRGGEKGSQCESTGKLGPLPERLESVWSTRSSFSPQFSRTAVSACAQFCLFCSERCDCGGIYLQREQSRTVAANLKLAVGSAFRSVKDRADISTVFGRAEL